VPAAAAVIVTLLPLRVEVFVIPAVPAAQALIAARKLVAKVEVLLLVA